jgi:glycosyltransferase involved in cell wall biosynthesis
VINLFAIRTHYPHWAARSGISRYLDYMDPKVFKIFERLVPMGHKAVPAPIKYLKKTIKQAIAKSGNRFYDVNDYYAELSVCRQVLFANVDIVQYLDPEHSLNYLPGWLKGTFFPRRKRPVIVGMFHQPTSVLREILSLDLVKDLDHIILMSGEQKDYFADRYPDEKMSVILHGVDTDYYRPDYNKRDGKKFRCVTVGHWLRDYDVLENVAASLIGNTFIEFHIVSNVTLKTNLKNIIRHKNISDDGLRDLYQRANLLFLPFKDATANNAILEGMACGLPILTTDLFPTREYLRDADAFFIRNNSIEGFRGTIVD